LPPLGIATIDGIVTASVDEELRQRRAHLWDRHERTPAPGVVVDTDRFVDPDLGPDRIASPPPTFTELLNSTCWKRVRDRARRFRCALGAGYAPSPSTRAVLLRSIIAAGAGHQERHLQQQQQQQQQQQEDDDVEDDFERNSAEVKRREDEEERNADQAQRTAAVAAMSAHPLGDPHVTGYNRLLSAALLCHTSDVPD
jgi:hypothetical protein